MIQLSIQYFSAEYIGAVLSPFRKNINQKMRNSSQPLLSRAWPILSFIFRRLPLYSPLSTSSRSYSNISPLRRTLFCGPRANLYACTSSSSSSPTNAIGRITASAYLTYGEAGAASVSKGSIVALQFSISVSTIELFNEQLIPLYQFSIKFQLQPSLSS